MKSIKNYKELAVSGLMMDTYQNPHFALSGGPEPLKKTIFVSLSMSDRELPVVPQGKRDHTRVPRPTHKFGKGERVSN